MQPLFHTMNILLAFFSFVKHVHPVDEIKKCRSLCNRHHYFLKRLITCLDDLQCLGIGALHHFHNVNTRHKTGTKGIVGIAVTYSLVH